MKNSSNTVQAFWVAMGTLSSMALTLVSAAILSRYFDKTEYGTYRQIIYIYNSLLAVFTAGLPKVFAYFLPKYELQEGKDIVWKVSKLLFLFGLIFSIFLFFGSSILAQILKNPELERGLKYFSPIPLLLLPTLGIEGIFSTYKKTIYIAIYNTSTRLMMLLFIVLPVIILKGDYLYAIYGWVVVSIITFLMAIYFKSIPFKKIEGKISNLDYKQILSYSLPLVGATLGGIAISAADQFFISRYFGTETFAEFSNGFIQLPFAAVITGSAATVLMPRFSEIIHRKSHLDELKVLWRNTLTKSALLIYPMVIFFMVNAERVVVLLYSDAYSQSTIYFQIALVLNFFKILVIAPLILALGKTKFYAALHLIFAIITWIGEYIIITIFHSPIMLAISSITISSLLTLVALWYSSKIISIPFLEMFPLKKMVIILLHSTLTIGIVEILINGLLNFESLFLTFIISLIGYIVLLLFTSKPFKLNYILFLHPLLRLKTQP